MTVKTNSKIDTMEDVCSRCGNHYLVIWLKEGEEFNDFGDRYCPFCGFITDEFYIPVKEP